MIGAARRCVLACSLLALGAGCIVPQNIEEMDPPREGNDAPRIVHRLPEETTLVTQRAPGCSLTLEVVVQDYDREDELEIRWFVDYGPANTAPVTSTVLPAAPEMRDGMRNPSSATFEFVPRRYVVGDAGYVVVEAVVSDGFDPTPGAWPENRAVLQHKDADLTSWKIAVTGEECRR